MVRGHHQRAYIVDGAAVTDVAGATGAAIAGLVSPIGTVTAIAAVAADGAVGQELTTQDLQVPLVPDRSARAGVAVQAGPASLAVGGHTIVARRARDASGSRSGIALERATQAGRAGPFLDEERPTDAAAAGH